MTLSLTSPANRPVLLLAPAFLSLLLAACRHPGAAPPAAPAADSPAGGAVDTAARPLRISGPYRHENLSVFLVHGDDATTTEFITLDAGLRDRTVVLSERGGSEPQASTSSIIPPDEIVEAQRPEENIEVQEHEQELEGQQSASVQTLELAGNFTAVPSSGATVNTLEIENLGDRPLYIQAGDIVKGGQQDRTIARDLVIAPRSGKVPIAAFCVESGRWTGRAGAGDASRFVGNFFAVCTKDLKLAVRKEADQGKVWEEVANAQALLSANVGATVNDPTSPSSLQLALENTKLVETIDGYVEALAPLLEEHRDAVGYAFAVDGELNSADVYASNALFRSLWPKLLRSSAAEAVASRPTDGAEGETAATRADCTAADVLACIGESAGGATTTEDLGNGVTSVSRESEQAVRFDTRQGEVTLRANVLTK